MKSEYSYLNFFQKLYQNQNRSSIQNVHSIGEFSSWRTRLVEDFTDLLGIRQLQEYERMYRGQNLKVEELETIREDGYQCRKYRIETLPQVFMPFYMLVPDGMKEDKMNAAMLALPAHGANKDTVAGVIHDDEVRQKLEKSPKESYGKEFAKMGYIVLCPDLPGFGERIEPLPIEDSAFAPDFRQSKLGSSCKNLAQTAEALGLTFQSLVLWDMMCLVDFAERQPMIDSSRIGCAGFSGGGLSSMLLGAMDERIKLVVISGYLHGYYDSIFDTHLCPCNYLPKLWQKADVCDIASMIAPRYLFIENGYRDALNGHRGILDPIEQANHIRNAYQLFGMSERMVHQPFEGKHEWYGGCYEFVKSYL